VTRRRDAVQRIAAVAAASARRRVGLAEVPAERRKPAAFALRVVHHRLQPCAVVRMASLIQACRAVEIADQTGSAVRAERTPAPASCATMIFVLLSPRSAAFST